MNQVCGFTYLWHDLEEKVNEESRSIVKLENALDVVDSNLSSNERNNVQLKSSEIVYYPLSLNHDEIDEFIPTWHIQYVINGVDKSYFVNAFTLELLLNK